MLRTKNLSKSATSSSTTETDRLFSHITSPYVTIITEKARQVPCKGIHEIQGRKRSPLSAMQHLWSCIARG